MSDPPASGATARPSLADAPESLLARVLSGKSRRLQLHAADGLLPLEPEKLAALQTELGSSLDEDVARRAVRSLQATDPSLLSRLARDPRTSNDQLLFLCETVPHPLILEAVVENPGIGVAVLRNLARWIPEAVQSTLLLRQEDLRRHPEILEDLEQNPELSLYARRRIGEYRQHLLPRGPLEHGRRPSPEPEPEAEPEESEDDKLVAEAIEKVAREVEPEGEVDDTTGLTEMQIRELPVSIRLKLTYGASLAMRRVLIKDIVPQVAVAALKNGTISEQEIERFCVARNIVPEVLIEVANNRRWMSRYSILVAVVRNPRTPEGIALRMLPRLSAKDMRSLSLDRGVAQVVRDRARRMHASKIG